jgi:hypothetical protein
MTIVYRSKQPLDLATITFKPANPNSSNNLALIAKQVFIRLSVAAASPSEFAVILPATPGLTDIKEVVITHEPKTAQPVDLVIERFTVKPMGPSLVSTIRLWWSWGVAGRQRKFSVRSRTLAELPMMNRCHNSYPPKYCSRAGTLTRRL